ncbi:MAG: prenyltransferase [Syntrophothermus sp.]
MNGQSMVLKLGATAKGFYMLLRWLPVLSWSVSAFVVGIGFAVDVVGLGRINWLHVLLILGAGVLFQGFTAHAFNDWEDWRSGTDRLSPGILSGGTKVIPRGVFTVQTLIWIGTATLFMGLGIGFYFVMVGGPLVWLFIATGVWAAVGYTMPPLRLAYRPFLGEWAAAWPAMVACTVGAFYILTRALTWPALLAGAIQATFCVGWLMQHHLPDIEADLRASPAKITTVALIRRRWGIPQTRWAAAIYFTVAALLGLAGALAGEPVFLVSTLLGVPAVALALLTNPESVPDITNKQLGMIRLTVAHAILLTALVNL